MARTLPNLGLKAFYAQGEDGWANDVDLNFLKLSVLTQGGILSVISAKPGSPAAGAVYVMAASDSTNPNTIAVYDGGQWKHFSPQKGWLVYDRGAETYLHFTGTAWIAVPVTSAKLAGLAAMDASEGVVVQTGENSYGKRAIGVASTADLLSRAHGDARYSAVSHIHNDSVLSFMGRQGAVSLLSADIATALGFAPQPVDSTLTGLSTLTTNSGVIEQVAPNTFSTRAVGITSGADLLTRDLGDVRYTANTPLMSALASLNIDEGVLVQNGINSFVKRPLDDVADAESLLSIGISDARYLRVGQAAFTGLGDVPSSYTGKGNYTVRVKPTEDGIEFVTSGLRNLATVGTTTHTLSLANGGQVLRCTNASETTITVPENANVAFPIGTTIQITRAGSGNVKLITDASAFLDLPAGKKAEVAGKNGTITLTKVANDRWVVSGDLAVTVNTPTADYTLVDSDNIVRMSVGGANTVTVEAGLAHHIGHVMTIVQAGAGQTTVAGGIGVTINTAETMKLRAQYSSAFLIKVGPDAYDLCGDLEPTP